MTVILRADVPQTKTDRHCCPASKRGEGCVQTTDDPYVPIRIEIEQISTGYLLTTIDEKGWTFVETWHESIQDAQTEARDAYGVDEDTWVSVAE